MSARSTQYPWASLKDEDSVALFHDAYRRRYGHSMPRRTVEFVNLRLAAVGRVSSAPAESSVTGSDPPCGIRPEGTD